MSYVFKLSYKRFKFKFSYKLNYMRDKYQTSAQQLDITNSEVKIAKKVFFLKRLY